MLARPPPNQPQVLIRGRVVAHVRHHLRAVLVQVHRVASELLLASFEAQGFGVKQSFSQGLANFHVRESEVPALLQRDLPPLARRPLVRQDVVELPPNRMFYNYLLQLASRRRNSPLVRDLVSFSESSVVFPSLSFSGEGFGLLGFFVFTSPRVHAPWHDLKEVACSLHVHRV